MDFPTYRFNESRMNSVRRTSFQLPRPRDGSLELKFFHPVFIGGVKSEYKGGATSVKNYSKLTTALDSENFQIPEYSSRHERSRPQIPVGLGRSWGGSGCQLLVLQVTFFSRIRMLPCCSSPFANSRILFPLKVLHIFLPPWE